MGDDDIYLEGRLESCIRTPSRFGLRKHFRSLPPSSHPVSSHPCPCSVHSWRCFLCPGNAQLALGICTYDVNTGPLPILLTNLLQSGVQCFSTDNETVLETLKSLTQKLLARGVLTYRCNVSYSVEVAALCRDPIGTPLCLGVPGSNAFKKPEIAKMEMVMAHILFVMAHRDGPHWAKR